MTIAVDFDGVIHAYSKGWQDGSIYDPPLPGAIESLRALMEVQPVFIFTSRDPEQVAEWLNQYMDIPVTYELPGEHTCEFWNERDELLVTNRKLPAIVYIDDRGLTFKSWAETFTALAKLGVEVK